MFGSAGQRLLIRDQIIPPPPMRLSRLIPPCRVHCSLFAAGILAATMASAQSRLDPAKTNPPPDDDLERFSFSLVPQAFKKNPNLDLTVVSEMTAEGKKRPLVDSAHPAYFVMYTQGEKTRGDDVAEKAMTPSEVQRLLIRSLAPNGYQPATKAHPPSLLVLYTWGSYNNDIGDNAITASRGVIERAGLVGGERFAHQVGDMMKERADLRMGGMPTFAADMLDPFRLYQSSDPKHAYIMDQVKSELYYVVASAYDFGAMRQHQRVLLWRTRMTVDSRGVAQTQVVPVLIAKAAPFFGTDMIEPRIMVTSLKKAVVEVGDLREVPAVGTGEKR